MTDHAAPSQPAHGAALTEAERLQISAVVHQNYYMPDVFAVVEAIIASRAGGDETALFAAISERRADRDFRQRLHDRVAADRPILDRLAAQPAHEDNEAALRALAEEWSTLAADSAWASARVTWQSCAGQLLAALSASAEPEGGERR